MPGRHKGIRVIDWVKVATTSSMSKGWFDTVSQLYAVLTNDCEKEQLTPQGDGASANYIWKWGWTRHIITRLGNISTRRWRPPINDVKSATPPLPNPLPGTELFNVSRSITFQSLASLKKCIQRRRKWSILVSHLRIANWVYYFHRNVTRHRGGPALLITNRYITQWRISSGPFNHDGDILMKGHQPGSIKVRYIKSAWLCHHPTRILGPHCCSGQYYSAWWHSSSRIL